MDRLAWGRSKKAEKAIDIVRPFLASRMIPLSARIAVVRGVILASVLYGGEIWGMNQVRCEKAQILVNKALRVVVGARERDTTIPVAAMWRETGIAPIHAWSSARRARACIKYPQLTTWIAVLFRHMSLPKKPSWIATSITWMKRWEKEVCMVREC